VGTNIFSGRKPSGNGLSDFERGLATGGFQHGGGGKAAVSRAAPVERILSEKEAVTTRTDVFPGHSGYLYLLQKLRESVADAGDKIELPAYAFTFTPDDPKVKLARDGDTITAVAKKSLPTSVKKNYKGGDTTHYRMSKETLAKLLLDRYFDDHRQGDKGTNASWIDPKGTMPRSELETKLLDALTIPQGFPSFEDPTLNPLGFRQDSWATWAGEHWGYWFTDYYQDYVDVAEWKTPVPEPTTDPEDDPDRVYDHQHVTWLERPESVNATFDGVTHYFRHGWNSSHWEVPYIWGWDPKEFDEARVTRPGHWGVHLGYPFRSDGRHDIRFILWLTPREVFLEAVNLTWRDTLKVDPAAAAQAGKVEGFSRTIEPGFTAAAYGFPKSSTALNGRGQWTIVKPKYGRVDMVPNKQ
jgi:hypothetical protein